jgi:hypothetical protein
METTSVLKDTKALLGIVLGIMLGIVIGSIGLYEHYRISAVDAAAGTSMQNFEKWAKTVEDRLKKDEPKK